MITSDNFEAARQAAIQGTRPPLSLAILADFERLVAHKGISLRGGLHYQDFDLRGAICCTAEEATLLYHMADMHRPLDALEIGCYVGWSTAHIATATPLTCIDPFTELDGYPGFDPALRFGANIARCGLSLRVRLIRGASPEAVRQTGPSLDFVYIDGHHHDGQPMRDALAIFPLLTEDALVIWHDAELDEVAQAIGWMSGQGFETLKLDTPNSLTLLYRRRPVWLGDLLAVARVQALTLEYA